MLVHSVLELDEIGSLNSVGNVHSEFGSRGSMDLIGSLIAVGIRKLTKKLKRRLDHLTDLIEVQTQEIHKMAGELEALQAKVAEIQTEATENQAKFDLVAATLTALITRLIELQCQPQALLDLVVSLEAARQAIDSSQSSVDDEVAAAQAVLNPQP